MDIEEQSDGFWLACSAAEHICALPLAGVVETMRPLPLEAFPRAPSFVAGLSIIRSQPTPVVDMRRLMGEPAGRIGRYVTVRVSGRIVALAFDAVLGIHRLSRHRVIDLPPLLQSAAGEAVTHVTAKDKELLLFLQSSRIFPPGLLESLTDERASA